MSKSRQQLVSPSGKGRETKFVLIAATIVLTTCATLIFLSRNVETTSKLSNYQINAFSVLNEKELAIFNGLYTTAVEINEIHNEEDGEWLTVSRLEADLLPPFVKDSAWKKNGRYKWVRTLPPAGPVDIALYRGNPAEKGNSGSFLLLFLHDHEQQTSNSGTKPKHTPYEIWYHTSPDKQAPQIITDQAFIAAGWKEVIAYSGETEVRRIKG